jgi:hypothetical protein
LNDTAEGVRKHKGAHRGAAIEVPRTPSLAEQRKAALGFAFGHLDRHREAERLHRWLFIGFQTLTIVAAGAATVMAVSDPERIPAEFRAIPAAIATLAAAVLASFQFRGGWRRQQSAARRLHYEILKYAHEMREYRINKPEPEPEAESVDLFLERVDAISRSADEEPGEVVPEDDLTDPQKPLPTE